METNLLKVSGSNDFAIIDAEDYERVKSFNLEANYGGKNSKLCYVSYSFRKKGKRKRFSLAKLILGCANDKRIHVKYLNQNTFDLRKSNLMPAITVGNTAITIRKSYNGKKTAVWVVNAYFPETKKTCFIGSYTSEQNAKNVIRFIDENKIPISSEEEIKSSRSIILAWAFENGFTRQKEIRPIYKIGDEKIVNDFVYIKTQSGWRTKHHLIWEEAGNTIPENYNLLFKDGNKRNFDLANLEVFSPAEKVRQLRLLKYPKELRRSVELIWKLKREIKEHENSQPKTKKIHPRSLRNSFTVRLYHSSKTSQQSNSPWRVDIYCPSIYKIGLSIGAYNTREIAQEIVDFIKASNFSIKSREDIENIRSLVRNFAVEKGYRKPSKTRNKSTINLTTEKR